MNRRVGAIVLALTIALAARTELSIDSGAIKRLLVAGVAVVLAVWVTKSESRVGGGLAWLGFVGWSLATVGVSAHGAAVPVVILYTSAVVVALGVAAMGLGRARVIAIATGTLLGLAVATHVLFTFASGGRGLTLEGGQGNPNWAGMVLAMALVLGVEAMRRTRHRVAVVAVIGVTALALGMTHARVAWVALAVAGVWLFVSARRARATLALAGGLVVIGAVITQGSAAKGTGKAVAQTVTAYEAPAEIAFAGRVAIARVGLSAARAHMPLGAGLGGFPGAYLAAQGDRLAYLPAAGAARRFVAAETAHDDYVQALVETGPLGLALLVAALIGSLRAQKNPGLRAALIVFSVCALGDSPLWLPATVVLLALIVASTPAPTRRLTGLERYALVGVAGLALAFALRARASDLLVARAELEPEHRTALLTRAARIDPWSGEAALRLGLARLDQGDIDDAQVALLHARRLQPSVAVELALGGALDAAGDPMGADAAVRRALALHPGSFRAWLARAALLRARGELDEAQRALDVARTILPHHPALEGVRMAIAEGRLESVD